MSQAKDQFFAKEEGVIAVYDLDYNAAYEFNYELSKNSTYAIMAIPHCIPMCPFICCYVNSSIFMDNVNDKIRAQHVALTRDGIKYVTEMHKTGCRLDCQDQGKLSKTVPYDKITDCDIEEPAGSSGPCCCMVKNVLTVVNVDTASGARGGSEGGARGHELSIQGLVDPHKFKKDVWAMKRGEMIEGAITSAVTASMAIDRSGDMDLELVSKPKSSSFFGGEKSAAAASNSDLASLMVENNKLLVEQNSILQKILSKK